MSHNNRYNRGRGGRAPYRFKREIPRGDEDEGQSSSHSPREKPPSHLKGREIGLWYRDKQAVKAKQQLMGPNVSLPIAKINQIRQKLNLISNINHTNDFISSIDTSSKFQTEFLRVTSSDLEANIKNASQNFRNDHLPDGIDENLCADFEAKSKSTDYCKMMDFRQKLPAFGKRELILQMVEANQIILIKGETGCGKTTQVAQFILDQAIAEGKGSTCRIVCTQPRRIAAITIAERVASERAERLGDSCGFQIRLDSVLPRPYGSILYCTTGIVLKRMEGDTMLLDYSHIILDEIHERDVNTDTLISLLKMIVGLRKNLKVILMSATLRAEYFSEYFFNCPMLEIEGFTYKVEEKYLEDVLEETQFFDFETKGGYRRESHKFAKYFKNFKSQEKSNAEFLEMMLPHRNQLKGKYSQQVLDTIMRPETEELNIELVEALILHISRNCPPGAILVFLPGYDSISKLYNKISSSSQFPKPKYAVYPLHSMLPSIAQKSVFERPPEGVRKIIIATNIAETSITIDDVVYVVNAGRLKQTYFDKELNVQTMVEDWNTLANAKQRRGRAGRVQEGVCYHLYTRAREATFSGYPTPEILRIRLENLILSLKILCVQNLKGFLSEQMIDPPDEEIINRSIEMLQRLNALDANEKLTPLGLHLARLPMDPQAGKMVLFGAIFSCFDPISSVAASLSFKNPFYAPIGKERDVDDIKVKFAKDTQSDHLMLANTIDEWRLAKQRTGNDYGFCRENFLNFTILNQLEKMKQQFCDLLFASQFLENNEVQSKCNNTNSKNKKLMKGIILAALFPNIAYLKKVKTFNNRCDAMPMIMTYEDKSVKIHPSSINCRARSFDSKYMTYFVKQRSSSTYIFDITVLNVYPILFFGDKLELGEDDNGRLLIVVGDHHKFQCDMPTAQLIIDLRKGLENLLQKKICEPSPTDWSVDSDEGNLLQAIIDLISTDGGNDDDYDN